MYYLHEFLLQKQDSTRGQNASHKYCSVAVSVASYVAGPSATVAAPAPADK
jgi:hypothetical protein